MMTLMHARNDSHPRMKDGHLTDQEIVILAAQCGNVAAVRLWLAQGIPAQWALSAAVKHGQREVVAYLIAHGANPLELSSSEQLLLAAMSDHRVM